jgi:hypothetical protein
MVLFYPFVLAGFVNIGWPSSKELYSADQSIFCVISFPVQCSEFLFYLDLFTTQSLGNILLFIGQNAFVNRVSPISLISTKIYIAIH